MASAPAVRIPAVVRLGATLALAFGLVQLLAHASHERRPFQDHPVHQLIPHAPGVGMPSDHATAAFAIAFGVLLFLSRPAGLALTGLAVLIGFARVWTGVHYPSDILAAAAVAATATFFVYVAGIGPRAATALDGSLHGRTDDRVPVNPSACFDGRRSRSLRFKLK